MATYTSNYGWTKPSGSDNVDISVLNNNLDGQDGVIHDAFLNMAPPFSESSTYAVNDIVLYGTTTYKCHTAVTTAGAWTGSTNWQVYKLSEGGSGGGGTSNYNQLTNKPQINSVELSGNKTTSDLGINADNVMMSDGVTSVEDALTNVTSGTFTGLLGFTFTWTKYGKIVSFYAGNDTTKIPQGNTIIGDIPDNILPTTAQTFDCNRSFVNKCCFIITPSTKKITIYCDIPTGSSSPYYVQGNVTYM